LCGVGVEFSCGIGGGVDIIIRCVENDGLPVGEAGGAWNAKLKDVYRVELSVNLREGYLSAPNLCIWCDGYKG
jgi:hypothetical protein